MPRPLDVLALASYLRRAPDAHKGDAGNVLLIGGSAGMAGAILLSGYGALYGGAGWVVIGMLDPKYAHALADRPELMLHDISDIANPSQWLSAIKPDCVAIGPGLGQDQRADEFLSAAIDSPVPLVIDADAINIIAGYPTLQAKLRGREAHFVLTPHPGEAARLLHRSSESIQANRLESLEELIRLYPGTIILKGHHTLLGYASSESLECQEGNAAMASGGMGDVLTGLIAALAAQGVRHNISLWEAACLGVQLHAKASDQLVSAGIGPIGLTALELAQRLAEEIRSSINQT